MATHLDNGACSHAAASDCYQAGARVAGCTAGLPTLLSESNQSCKMHCWTPLAPHGAVMASGWPITATFPSTNASV